MNQRPAQRTDNASMHLRMISSGLRRENRKVRIKIPNVPITSENEEVEMARVSINPDCSTDSRAKFKAKYIKKRNIHKYMSKNVAFFTELYRNRSK